MLTLGLTGKESLIVNLNKCASAVGSGELAVLATPVLAALMEQTAAASIAGKTEKGTTTVGTSLSIRHLSPTPVGMTVYCESELTEIDGRRLVFKLTAYDAAGVIGTATHERVIIDREAFLRKADEKRAQR